MAPRQLNDWIASYLDYNSNDESPERSHFWTAIGVLSAAIGRKVWMSRGTYKLYTNMYVCIVADSAKVRKSAAIEKGLDILLDAIPGLPYLEDRMTPEGIVKHLNRVVVSQNGSNITVNHDSTLFIYEDELAALFGYEKQTASRMSIFLTGTYGCKPKYMHTTSTGGHVLINNACFTILAATAPENLVVLPPDASGGFLGRLVIISSGTRRRNIAWPSFGPDKLRLALISDLAEINKLDGEFIITPEAREFFEVWYNKQAAITFKERWMNAFHERCHDTALKVAMLLGISRSDNLVLNVAHVEAGIKTIEELLPGLKHVGIWLTPGEFGQARARVEELIEKAKTIRRSDVLKVTRISAKELDEIESTLEQENYMTINVVGRDRVYDKIV